MTEREEVISTIRATLLSCKGASSLDAVNRDYRELQGKHIPFTKLGYKSLIELFKSIPGFKVNQTPNGEYMIDAIPTEETKNLANLIARQKNSKKSSLRSYKPPPRRPKMESWNPTASSKYWQYKNSNKMSRHNNAYFKPQSPEKKYSKPAAPPKRITKSIQNVPEKTIHNVPDKPVRNISDKPIQSVVSNNVKKPQKSVAVAESQKSPPASTLSGFKPSDILARAISNNKSNTEEDSSRIVTTKKRSMAADRMAALKISFQNDRTEPEIPIMDDIKEKISKLTVDRTYVENNKRLLELTKLMNLSEPIIKTCENKPKGRYPSTFDCIIKVGEYSFSTYPDSLNTRELAIESAAFKALEKLSAIAIERNSKPSTSPSLALSKVVQLVAEYPNGLWAKELPNEYQKKFSETLPHNWLSLIESSPLIETEETVSGMIMLLPAKEKIISPSSSTSNVSSSNDDNTYPPELQYPEDSQWNVFIMSANSTVEIWLRIIGEQYSGAFEQLNTEMECYYENCFAPSNNLTVGEWYALKCDDGWLRSRILEVDLLRRTAVCFLIDTGDEESHPFINFYDLPIQFLNVAPQAILCRLAGLEEYSVVEKVNDNLDKLLVSKVLIAEVIQSPDDVISKDDPTITVVLYDTSTNEDLNLNKHLLHLLTLEAKSPQLSHGITEIFVCEVTSNATICAQIHNEYWKMLQKMLQQVVDGPFPKEALQASSAPFLPKPNAYYLAKTSSGEWRRAVLQSNLINSVDGETFINVKYIDYGSSDNVSVKDLLLLERVSEALNSYPVQVIKLSLHNVSYMNRDNLKRLNELLPRDVPVLCKQMLLGSNQVEIFVRTQPNNVLYSVNNAINMEKELAKKSNYETKSFDPLIELTKKKERIFQQQISKENNGVLPKFNIPEKGNQFNITVSIAANPYNFTVQSLREQPKLQQMMETLQTVSNLVRLTSTPVIGNVYAAYYEKDNSWYRVYVQGMVSNEKVSVYFCDYGDLDIVHLNDLRELPYNFKQLPAQALKARLHGVSPIHKDWSVDDCLQFQKLVVEKNFASIIENVEQDPLHTNELLLTLNLIDTSSTNDVYINRLLSDEGRARLI